MFVQGLLYNNLLFLVIYANVYGSLTILAAGAQSNPQMYAKRKLFHVKKKFKYWCKPIVHIFLNHTFIYTIKTFYITCKTTIYD